MKIIKASQVGWIALFLVMLAQAWIPSPAMAAWCSHLGDVPVEAVDKIDRLARAVVHDEPNPMPAIKTEGLMPGEGLFDASQAAKGDFEKARTLAYGWNVTHKKEYLASAERLVRAWVGNYRPSGNPIDETKFTHLFEAYALIRSDISKDSRSAIDQWVSGFHESYLKNLQDHKAAGIPQTSNWQSHRIKIAVAAAVSVENDAALSKLAPYFHAQVRANIRDDGSVEDFHKRDSLSYAVYSLQALVESALIAKLAGHDWYQEVAQSRELIDKAIQWLEPYVRGEKQHVEFENSKVQFDRIRAQAGIKGHMVELWEPKGARNLYWSASYLRVKYAGGVHQSLRRPPVFLEACYGAR